MFPRSQIKAESHGVGDSRRQGAGEGALVLHPHWAQNRGGDPGAPAWPGAHLEWVPGSAAVRGVRGETPPFCPWTPCSVWRLSYDFSLSVVPSVSLGSRDGPCFAERRELDQKGGRILPAWWSSRLARLILHAVLPCL